MAADSGLDATGLIASLFGSLLLAVALYVYFAAALMIIARKTGTPNAGLAWIPIANIYLMCRIAGKPGWWILLFLIPLVNLIVAVIVWMGIAAARGKAPASGVLIVVPLVNLFIPAYIASGGSAQPVRAGAVPSAGVPPTPRAPASAASGLEKCSGCGARLEPGEAFCGECGALVTAAAPPPPYAGAAPASAPARSSHAGVAIAAIGAVVILGLGGWLAYSQFLGSSTKRAAVPARLAGALKEFPVDTGPDSPARPRSFTTRDLRASARTSASNTAAKGLPPGITDSHLRRSGVSISSAGYSTEPASPQVNVHVIETPPDQPKQGGTLADSVQRAAGPSAQRSSVQVKSPDGDLYTGSAIRTPQILVYVLDKQDAPIVIVVYSDDPSTRDVAQRLAGNVGNGEGLADYPGMQDMIAAAVPPAPPPGLTLEESNSYDTSQLLTPGALEKSLDILGSSEAREVAAKVRPILPNRITAARYSDSSRRPWNVLTGDYGGLFRAWIAWAALRVATTVAGLESAPGGGLTAVQDRERYLLRQKGPVIVLVSGPSSEPAERLAALIP